MKFPFKYHRHKWKRTNYESDAKTGDVIITNECMKCDKKDIQFYYKGEEYDDT